MIQILSGVESSASAMEAERVRMEVVSQNIANAYTTRGPNGGPYQRQQVVFENVLLDSRRAIDSSGSPEIVRIARIESDGRPPRMISNPTHPDADANGMVAMPNINIHEEMVDLIAASRAFEANLAVVKTARGIALQTLNIGKR